VKLKSHFWWDYSTREFAALDMSRVVAVQPVGAVEQHGPHLPVRVDGAINAGIVERAVAMMADDVPALVLPMMPVGKSNEHAAFPGTLTLWYETLARVWFELGESVHRAGCRRIIFFNSHGGQPQVAQIVCRELRVKLGMLAVDCMWSRTIEKSDLFSATELAHGIHGGEVETSVMLHLHANLVDMGFARNFAPLSLEMERAGALLTPEGLVGFGWQAQDLEPSGACGDAASADARRGGVVVDRAAAALLQLITEVEQFPLSRLAARTAYDG
jgi:creatinine amidohydrolase